MLIKEKDQNIKVGEFIYIFEDPQTEKIFEGIATVDKIIKYTQEYVDLLVHFNSEDGTEPSVQRRVYFL